MSKLTELKERFTKDFEEAAKQKNQLEGNLAQLNSKLEQLRGAIFALEVAAQPEPEQEVKDESKNASEVDATPTAKSTVDSAN